jgi:hypothetical protein
MVVVVLHNCGDWRSKKGVKDHGLPCKAECYEQQASASAALNVTPTVHGKVGLKTSSAWQCVNNERREQANHATSGLFQTNLY